MRSVLPIIYLGADIKVQKARNSSMYILYTKMLKKSIVGRFTEAHCLILWQELDYCDKCWLPWPFEST